jgi:hypothetical protein
MLFSDVTELYYITHIENIPSIIRFGILAHNRVEKLGIAPNRIDEPGVQEHRKIKKIPGTNKSLHDYANLYFDAHNPMLSARRNQNDSICVLRIKKNILNIGGVIVTDKNAARPCWFKPVQEGLPLLNKDEIFARYWTNSDDYYEEQRLKGVKCAEVLVPDCIPVAMILGAFVANNMALRFFQSKCSLPVQVNTGMFF